MTWAVGILIAVVVWLLFAVHMLSGACADLIRMSRLMRADIEDLKRVAK